MNTRTRNVLGLVMLLRADVARAGRPLSATLSFENASTEATCPDERTFRDRVASRVGRDPFDAGTTRRIEVHFRDDGLRVVVRLGFVRDGARPAKRELMAPRAECAELAESAAVAVSLMLDPLATGDEPPAASTPPSAAPPLPPPPTATPQVENRTSTSSNSTAPVPTPEERPRPRISALVAPVAAVGVGPAATMGGRAGALLEIGRLALGAEGQMETTPGAVTIDADRVHLLLMTGALVPCYARTVLRGCAVARFGVAQGEMTGLDRDATRRNLAAFAGLRLGGVFSLAQGVAFEPSAEVALALIRTRFEFAGTRIWTASTWTATLALALRAQVF